MTEATTKTRVGPKRVQHSGSYLSCFGCQYYSHRMIRSGRNPIYEDGCKHPTWDWVDSPHGGGRIIGENTDRTPQWCPVP